MAAIGELIRVEGDGSISFGDYTLGSKSKKEENVDGATYKVKTFKEITKLEKNEGFVYESTPGTAVEHLVCNSDGATFSVEGPEDAQITLEFLPETLYDIVVDGKDAGTMKTNLGGKLSLSVELGDGKAVEVSIKKA